MDGKLGAEEWSIGFLGGAYRIYPWDEGFVIWAGLGAGFASVAAKLPDGEETFNDFGLGLLGSVGWETRIAERVAVGPMLELLFVDVGNDVRSAP